MMYHSNLSMKNANAKMASVVALTMRGSERTTLNVEKKNVGNLKSVSEKMTIDTNVRRMIVKRQSSPFHCRQF